MSGWYSDWQTTIAWLVVTAVASVIYFGSMTPHDYQSVNSYGCVSVSDHSIARSFLKLPFIASTNYTLRQSV